MNQIVTIPTAGIGSAVAAYTIGFVKLEVHDRVEDAVGAGSGTLVTVGIDYQRRSCRVRKGNDTSFRHSSSTACPTGDAARFAAGLGWLLGPEPQ